MLLTGRHSYSSKAIRKSTKCAAQIKREPPSYLSPPRNSITHPCLQRPDKHNHQTRLLFLIILSLHRQRPNPRLLLFHKLIHPHQRHKHKHTRGVPNRHVLDPSGPPDKGVCGADCGLCVVLVFELNSLPEAPLLLDFGLYFLSVQGPAEYVSNQTLFI